MAVNVYQIAKPVIELSLDTGGDLPDATTYYFTGYYQNDAGYYGPCAGPAADEVFITTTAPNQKIVMQWKYWDGGDWVYGAPLQSVCNMRFSFKWDYYSMRHTGGWYKWCNVNDPAVDNEFSVGTGHQRWSHSYASAGYSNIVTKDILLADLLEGGDSIGNRNHPEVAWRYDIYPMNYNFDFSLGALVVHIDSDGSDQDDIIAALYASSFDTQYEIGKYSLVLYGTFVTGYSCTIDGMSIIFIANAPKNNNIVYSNGMIYTFRLTSNLWNNARGTFQNIIYRHNGNAFIQTAVNQNSFDYQPWCNIGITNYGSIVGYTSKNMPFHQYRYYRASYVIQDSIFDNCYIYGTPTGPPYNNDTMEWENVEFKNNVNQDIRLYFGLGVGVGFNQIFNVKGIKTDKANGKIRVNMFLSDTPDSLSILFNMMQTINFRITDKNGIPLIGTEVNITNSVGTIYNDITDTNGELSLYPITYTIEYDVTDTDGYGFFTKTTDLNPLTITISENGYQQYINTITIEEITNWDIALQEATTVVHDGTFYGLTIQ